MSATATIPLKNGPEANLTFLLPGGKSIRRILRAGYHHRYPHIPGIRVETTDGSLCGFAQYGTTFQQIFRYGSVFFDISDPQEYRKLTEELKTQVFEKMDEWEEVKPTIVRLKIDKGPERRGVSKNDQVFLVTGDDGKTNIISIYGELIPITEPEYEILPYPTKK
jgi:hypothetical protein